MPKLTDILTVETGETATIVGSGGKTSLLWLLAQHYRASKVLVTTTTHIGKPEASFFDVFHDSRTLLEHEVRPGISLAGETLTDGDFIKLAPIEQDLLASARTHFDRILIEGDGSKMLPLKGWAEYEPVIPPFSDYTIGIIPIWPLGHIVDDTIIHRLPLFCEISGASPGEPLRIEHLAKIIAHPAGLMKGSYGRKIIFINQVEDEQGIMVCRGLVHAIEEAFLRNVDLVIAGSVQKNSGTILWDGGYTEQ